MMSSKVNKLPTAGRENVLTAFVPASLTDLAWVALVLLNPSVIGHTDVVVDVEVEQRAALPTCFGHDEIIEGVIVGNDEVLLNIQ